MQIDRDRIALAVQQPWAELIVAGIKTVEIRGTAARVRGPIYIYASKKVSALPDAIVAAREHNLLIDELPRGAVIGNAELVGCRPARAEDAAEALVEPVRLINRMAWQFERPVKFSRPLSPRFVPYGIWFYPFRHRTN